MPRGPSDQIPQASGPRKERRSVRDCNSPRSIGAPSPCMMQTNPLNETPLSRKLNVGLVQRQLFPPRGPKGIDKSHSPRSIPSVSRLGEFLLATGTSPRQSTVEMRLHALSILPRGVVLIFAFATAAFLSFFSIRNALAAHYADLETRQGYERAVRLEPGDHRNLDLLGRYWQFNLEDPDTSRAIQAYLTSLAFNPRSANTWMDLAAAYESDGNLGAARNGYLQAKKDYPVSAEVAWRYGNFLLRQGEL